MSGVVAVSDRAVWAAGTYKYSLASTSGADTVIFHWDGDVWSRVASPNPGRANVLKAVAFAGASHGWAVGGYSTLVGNIDLPLILRWNGTEWSHVTNIQNIPSNADGILLRSVTVINSQDAWAVGEYVDKNTKTRQALSFHWDGLNWSYQAGHNVGKYDNFLYGTSAVESNYVFSAGSYDTVGVGLTFNTLTERWNGTAWAVVDSPNPSPGGNNQLFGIAKVPGTTVANGGMLWSVGYSNGRTLVMRYILPCLSC